MNRRRPRSSGIASIPWLGAGVSFVLGITGWASETPPDEASAVFGTTELSVHLGSTDEMAGPAGVPRELHGHIDAGPVLGEGTASVERGELKPSALTGQFLPSQIDYSRVEPGRRAGLKRQERTAPRLGGRPAADEELDLLIEESRSEERATRAELAEASGQVLPSRPEDRQAKSSGEAVPDVEVRVGDHGEFERVVFEWPEAIEYEVVQRGERVTFGFGRAGRIDLSPLHDGSSLRLVRASAAGGGITDEVALQVVPGATIRTFALEDGRVVAIDVHAEAPPRTASPAAPEPEQNSVEALRDALEQRDKVIDDLLVRMEQLERRLALSSPELDAVVAGGAGAAGGGRGVPSAPAGGQAAQPTPEPSQASGQESSSQGQGANDQAAPGEFDVAEEDVDRALERTLVQTGALLLPPGQAEVEPYFSYTRQEDDVPALFFDAGTLGVSDREVRRNEFVTGQALRVGLPFDSQVEFDLPYR